MDHRPSTIDHRALCALVLVVAAAAAMSGQQPATEPSKENFERLCGSCHEPERGTSSRRTRDQWLQIVNTMVGRGAQGTDEELLAAVEYLTREHGRVNVNLASAADIALVLGLTPPEAAAVVQYRREHGAFEDASGVERIPGVDARKIASRRDAMVFGSRVASDAGRVPVAALTAANNWPGVQGGPQREAWARPEAMLSRNTTGAVRLLYSRRFQDSSGRAGTLTPPLVLGNLISYRGFKEMLFVGASSDTVYSIDAVLNRILWTSQLKVASASDRSATGACANAGLMGIVMTGTSATGLGTTAGIRRPGAPPPGGQPAGAPPRSGLIIGLSSGFGRNGLLLAVGSDGRIHPLYQSNGAPYGAPLAFVPAGSRVRGVNLFDNTLYAVTVDGCSGPDAVYAVDLASDEKAVARFETGGPSAGSAGAAVGFDGTVYVQLADRVAALTAKDLKQKDHFLLNGNVTPAVFSWNGKDVVAAGGKDGRLVLLDSASLGGTDHRTPLAQTKTAGELHGAFASWEDPDAGTRWIYASAGSGIAAFKLEDRDGRPALSPAWTAADIGAPAPPVVGNGLVFALGTGNPGGRATLHILEAATGRKLFSSGEAVSAAAARDTGLAVANGRVYFSTVDGTLYSFGIPTEH
jgi:outer membrane protein assembly factor BamB